MTVKEMMQELKRLIDLGYGEYEMIYPNHGEDYRNKFYFAESLKDGNLYCAYNRYKQEFIPFGSDEKFDKRLSARVCNVVKIED